MRQELLPGGVSKLAEQCAKHLSAQTLKPDLESFLRGASDISGLQAVVLVVRRDPGIMLHLSIYAFTELHDLHESGSGASQVGRRVGTLYDTLDEAIHRGRSQITDGLSYVNTDAVSFKDAVRRFTDHIKKEPDVIGVAFGKISNPSGQSTVA